MVEALSRVLASDAFRRSEQSRAFLSYVVSEWLAGRAEQISERTVGRYALSRGSDFDGRHDASVRVRAARVREALERYYEQEGEEERIRIVIRPGRYVPEVSHVDRGASSSVPGILVLSTAAGGDGEAIAAATADALVQRLAEHPPLRIVGPTAVPADSAARARAVGVTTVLESSVARRGDSVRLVARLLSAADGGVVWSRTEDVALADGHGFDVVDRWAEAVAVRVGDLDGVVLSDAYVRHREPSSATVRAIVAYHAYLVAPTGEAIARATDAVEKALAVGPRDAPMLAMRGALANAAAVQGHSLDRAADTDLAEGLAREALALDGRNAHAHLVLAGALRTRRSWAGVIAHAETAAQLTPHRPINVVTSGLLVCAAGDWTRGLELVRDALAINPGLPGHAHLWPALGGVLAGDYATALAEATLVDVSGEVWGPLYRCLALSGLGHDDEAGAELSRLLVTEPAFLDEAEARFRADLNLADEQVDRILTLLDKARAAAAG